MMRKVLLVLMATIVSHSLAALSGYLIYTASAGWSVAHLSLVIRFMFTPAIAILTGFLVGLLSKDHPVPVSILGLAPWILNLFGPEKPAWPWRGPGVVYIVLGAISAMLAFRLRQQNEFGKIANASLKTQ